MVASSCLVGRRLRVPLARCLTVVVLVGLCGVGGGGCSGSGAVGPLPSPKRGFAVAARPNTPSFVVVDVYGTATEYPPQSHGLPSDAVDGVGVTPVGDVLVTIRERVFVVRDADFAGPPRELKPYRVRYRSGHPQEAYALSTHDGARVWIVQSGWTGADSEASNTLADLVRVEDGELLLTASVGGELFPVGTTNGDRLVLNERHGAVVTLSPDGESELLAMGRAIAAGPNHVAMIDNETGELVIVELAGDSHHEARIDPPSDGGRWDIVRGPGIPSIWLPWPTLSSDGRLLVSSATPTSRGLYLVSVRAGDQPTVELLTTGPPWLMAAWTGDYRSVWLFEGDHRVQLMDLAEDKAIRDLHQLDDNHFIMAAG